MPKYSYVYLRKGKRPNDKLEIEGKLPKATNGNEALEQARDMIVKLNESPQPGFEGKYVLKRVIKQVYP